MSGPNRKTALTARSRLLRDLCRRTGPGSAMLRDERGSVIIIFALALPVLLLAVGAAIDYGRLSSQKTRLQSAADAAALSAARELHMANADKSQVQSIAESVVAANLGSAAAGVTVSSRVLSEPVAVAVDLTQDVGLFFMGGDGSGASPLAAHAVARPVGGTPICVLGLEEKSAGAIDLNAKARMTGNACAVYSNSTNPSGIKSKDAAVLHASLICSAGGKVGGKANFEPDPLTDCPQMEDPLASRPPPPVGACTANDLEIEEQTTTLSPGVYCGGLKITDESRVTLQPGVYVIKDGQLEVEDNSELVGENVGFYLTGKGATFRFDRDSHISLTAPKDGPMAGLLFFEDRAAKQKQKYEIFSDDARMLLGTIYLPNGRLYIDAYEPIADRSAYTAIVVRQVELYAGPHLVLNSDYDATDIPVPDGISDVGKQIVLAE